MNHSKKFELDIVLAAARESQRQQQRDPLASVSAEVCTEFGQCKHGLTHFPSASWCPSCVAHRAGLDRHERTGESHAGPVPTIRFDYLFTEPDGQSRRDGGPESINCRFDCGGQSWKFCDMHFAGKDYTTVGPKQWVDSRSDLGKRLKHMK